MTVAWVEKLQSVNGWQAIPCAASAYLLGCFTTGYYLVRLRHGGDLRKLHSGSVGARNAGRVLGRIGFLVTALGDFGKGALAVWAALHWTSSDGLAVLAMLSVVAGHVWPVQLRFRGGKGVATSLGALLVYDGRLAATYAALVAVGFALTRNTVLPGLCAFACLPLACYWPDRDGLKVAFVGALAVIVLFAHRRNLVEEWSAFAVRRGTTPKPEPPR